MNAWVRHEYDRLRSRGWTASNALRAARIRDRFTDLEAEGLVKLEAVPEIDIYDDSYIDTWGLSPTRAARAKKELWDLIERDGCWIYVAYFRRDTESEWIAVDSIGCIIGSIKDSGYDVDLMRAAVEAFDDEASLEARFN